MNQNVFKFSLGIIAIVFTIYFGLTVIPAFFETTDFLAAVKGGFVNPFASAYSMDAIMSWIVLAIWVLYESNTVKYGWLALLLGIFPGVVVGFAFYLVWRMKYNVK